MKFYKAQTNGNDFVIIETLSNKIVTHLADRKYGIGCDQVILLKHDNNQYMIDFFNQDGSYAKMCGNGSCAVALLISRKFQTNDIILNICDKSYPVHVENNSVTLSVPKPTMCDCIINAGNNHIVLDVAEIDNVDKISRNHSECNIHFVKQLSKNALRVKTFERGVGWTLACGSGAIAVGYNSKIEGKITIIQDGGKSIVEVFESYVNLTTSPKIVFEGEYYE